MGSPRYHAPNGVKAASEAERVLAPFDDRLVGVVELATPELVERLLAGAREALSVIWPAHRRAAHLRAVAELLSAQQAELAELIALEGGKPVRLAAAEVERAVNTYHLSAAEALKLTGETIPMDASAAGEQLLGFTRPRPRGVVAAISSFNFPLNLVAHKVAPAIAAGCPVIVKPAEQTPLTALRLAELHAATNTMPAGFLTVAPGPGPSIGAKLADDPRVSVISFTGSAGVGWRLADRAGRRKVLLELGNSTPAIVHGDADLDLAAKQIAFGAYSGAGQSCISVQRALVDRAIEAQFLHRLTDAMDALVVGDPLDPLTDVGPVIDAASCTRIRDWVNDALDQGATLLRGGDADRLVVEPTLIKDPPVVCDVWQAEIFGPVLSVVSYEHLDDAIELANGTDHGLQAGIFTASLETARQVSDQLEFSTVVINRSPTFRADQMPYGGIKGSGNTREGPAYTIRELIHEQLLVLA
jgi:acyl-CoA reductase-like NAD-dependent aldehyde dehydrogenase